MSEINSDWPAEGRKAISCDTVHKRPEQYIAELLMINENDDLRHIRAFWAEPQYSLRYMNRLTIAKRHIETAGFAPVYRAVTKWKLTDLSQVAVQQLIIDEILLG